MFPGKLIFLVGPPRSGKTTYANKWLADGHKRIVISVDSIRLALTGCRYNSYGESLALATAETCVRAFLFDGYEVLVDDTNTTFEAWARWFRVDKTATYKYIWDDKRLGYEEFCSRVEECQQRALATGQGDLKNVIRRVADNLSDIRNDLDLHIYSCRAEVAAHHKYCITAPMPTQQKLK